MLPPDHAALIVLCLRILQQLSRQEPELGLSDEQLPGLAHRIASILSENLANGRFSYVCGRGYLSGADEDQFFNQYAENVCRVYVQEGNLIASLQAGEDEAWQRVHKRLVRLAFNKYLGKGAYNWALWEAQTLANAAAYELWRYLQDHSYPFDVPFDQWSACVLARRFVDWCRIQQRETLWLLPDGPIRPADTEGPTLLGRIGEKSLTQWLENYANQEWLLQAIERLPNPLERKAIQIYYLKERSVKEAAVELDVSENYMYVLLHRARRRLRRMLKGKSDERFGC